MPDVPGQIQSPFGTRALTSTVPNLMVGLEVILPDIIGGSIPYWPSRMHPKLPELVHWPQISTVRIQQQTVCDLSTKDIENPVDCV